MVHDIKLGALPSRGENPMLAKQSFDPLPTLSFHGGFVTRGRKFAEVNAESVSLMQHLAGVDGFEQLKSLRWN